MGKINTNGSRKIWSCQTVYSDILTTAIVSFSFFDRYLQSQATLHLTFALFLLHYNTWLLYTQHSICYNGRNYDRPTTVSPCACTREDFECDVGYNSQIFGFFCLPDSNITSTLDQVPPTCVAGGFYNRTKGYRKLAGDLCSGGPSESHYAPDRVPCPAIQENAFMFLSTSRGLYRVDMESNDTSLITPDVKSAVDLDFLYTKNLVFWARNTSLYVTNLNTSATTKIFLHVRKIYHLSLCWFSMNVYWTDSNGEIYLSNQKGATRRLEISNCSQAIELVTAPDKAYFYVICADRSRGRTFLSQLRMDGSNKTDIRSISSIPLRPSSTLTHVGLAYDVSTDRLFWIVNNLLVSSFRDGSGTRYLSSPTGAMYKQLSVFKNNVYWLSKHASYSDYSIEFTDKYQRQRVNTLRRGPPRWTTITSMKIFTKHSQLSQSVSPCIGRKCSQLCVPVPHLPGHGLVGECLCGNAKDLTIVYGPGGNEQCECSVGQHYNSSFGYCVATNHTCQPQQFLCSNNRCIDSQWKCDRADDCGDSSDELDCPVHYCSDGRFRCNSTGLCILGSWQCDHDNDCGDNSDEEGCEFPTCSPQQFTCTNYRCINMNYMCDGDNDCHDWSDEKNCDNRTSNATNKCNSHYQFYCAQPSGFWVGNCLPRIWVCDGTNDCTDGSDEVNCTSATTCTPYQRLCADGTCMFEWFWCDGMKDCSDGSDEVNCSATTAVAPTAPSFTTTTLPRNHTCSGTDRKCSHTGACYPLKWRCDGVNDCGDGSDEFDCPTNTTSVPSWGLPCISETFLFRCTNQHCIPRLFKCDGDNDCGDWSDEKDCPNAPHRDDGCIVGYGINYQGTRSYTKTGRTCQRWDVNYPQIPKYRPQDSHHNYCRDPDHDITGPWCYTTDPQKRWDYCGIPHCSTNPSSPTPPTAEPQSCGDGYLDCGAGATQRCIFSSLACDGRNDCSNGADELNCNNTCMSSEFHCRNGRCIAKRLRCNYNDDCRDNSDEQHCTSHNFNCNSPFGAFRCRQPSTTCIPTWKVCDGTPDCPDRSDEQQCSTTVASSTSPLHTCKNGQVVASAPRCDFVPQCKDMSDEENCHYVTTRDFTCHGDNDYACQMVRIVSPIPTPKPTAYVVYYAPGPIYVFNPKASSNIISTSSDVKLAKLFYNQAYSYGIAFNYTNYTLPIGGLGQFTTTRAKPDPPVITHVNQLPGQRISMKWKPRKHPKAALTGFRIYASSPGHHPEDQRVYGSHRIQTVLQLYPGRFSIKIQALSSTGPSSWSPIFNFTVFGYSSLRVAKPSLSNRTLHSALIKWKPLHKVSKYWILVKNSIDPPFYEGRFNVSGGKTNLWIHKLASGEDYEVAVAAYNGSISFGPLSSWLHFKTGGPPAASLRISSSSKPLSTTSVMLMWGWVNGVVPSGGVTYGVQFGESEMNLEPMIAVNNMTMLNVTNLPRNRLQLFRVSVQYPYIGRWSPFFQLAPFPDFSIAPTHLKVTVSKPFTSIRVCWETVDVQVTEYDFHITLFDASSNSVVSDLLMSAYTTQVCKDILNLKPSRVYRVSVRDVTGGKLGGVATRTFLNGDAIPPISTIRVVPVLGTSDYVLSYVVQELHKAFYTHVLRGVHVFLCLGKDVTSPKQPTCRLYTEMPANQSVTLLTNLKSTQWYTIFLSLKCPLQQECSTKPSRVSFETGQDGTSAPSSGRKGLSHTDMIAIAVSVAVVLVLLVVSIVYLVRRNRRLQHSYSSFVASHYDPQRGEAFFVNDGDNFDNGLDDEVEADTPLITGFADDEPLIVA